MLLFQGLHGRHFKQQLTLPRLRSFNMADKQELIDTIHEMKEERKLYKALPFGSAEWTAALPFMAALESRLAEQEKALVQLQGENLASRSPPHRLLSPHACQRIPEGGLSRTLGNFQRDDRLTGWLQSPVLRVPEAALCIR